MPAQPKFRQDETMNRSQIPRAGNVRARIAFLAVSLLAGTEAFSQSPDFHIYLAFGQSNMEGNGPVPAEDKTNVNPRFQVMAAVNCTNLGRTKGTWYTAVPPLCRCGTGLNPADYFGRTLVDTLPAQIKVGVINVSVAGTRIEIFDKATYQSYIASSADWLKNIAKEYGDNPYGRLVEMAKEAQKTGVIKGLLLHQGESNGGDAQWANKVKVVYDNLVKDLNLDPKTPLLAGDLVSPSTMVQKLPTVLANAKVISSQGLEQTGDGLHFSPKGYREFGKRYAVAMLAILKTQGSTGLGSERAASGYSLGRENLDPRNGMATVTIEIPRRAFVSLKAYTVGGKEIAELAGAEFAAGRHALAFAPKALPAGVSILRMRTDGFSATRRVVIGAD
jgi:lysophospholipase L1-like esterase